MVAAARSFSRPARRVFLVTVTSSPPGRSSRVQPARTRPWPAASPARGPGPGWPGSRGVVEAVAGAHRRAGPPGRLVDPPGITGIGWGDHHQVHPPGHIREQLGQVAGVALADLPESGLVGCQGVGEVGPGQFRPAWLQLQPDRPAAQGGRFDQGGPDPAHGVGDRPGRAPPRASRSDSRQRSRLGSGGAGARAAEGPAVGRW
jgi:hypothetical protein